MVGGNRLTGPDGLVLDLDQRTVAVQGDPVDLSRREFDLLCVLVEARGRVVPFDELAQRVWGHEVATTDQRFIYTTAWRLRRALEAVGAPNVVQGVRGVGYVVPEADEAAPSSNGVSALGLFDPTDPDLRIWFVNEAAVDLTGYDVETLTHLPSRGIRLWAPDERARIDIAVREAMESGAAATRGRKLLRADGGTVLVDVHLSRLDHGDRKPRLLAEVARTVARDRSSSE